MTKNQLFNKLAALGEKELALHKASLPIDLGPVAEAFEKVNELRPEIA